MGYLKSKYTKKFLKSKYKIILEKIGAGNGDRTRDPRLGKPMLYQLSYARPVTP